MTRMIGCVDSIAVQETQVWADTWVMLLERRLTLLDTADAMN